MYCAPQVAVLKSDSKALDKGTWSAVTAAPGQAQKVVTFHVSESGETVLQEAYEAATSETGELTQIAIEAYEGGGDFSVVEQAAEEIHSPGYRWRNTRRGMCYCNLITCLIKMRSNIDLLFDCDVSF